MRHLLLTAVAVALCCAATATAATVITGRQVKNNSLTTRDIKNRSLRAVDFRPGTLRPGPVGATGPTGPAGPAGAPGVARAYGYVSADGVLSRSRGVTRVTEPLDGIYCIYVDDAIDRATTIINATVEFPSSGTMLGTTGEEDTGHAQGASVVESSACNDIDAAADFQVLTFTQRFGKGGQFTGNVREGHDFMFVVP
jgi:hypothetical protein